MQKNKSLNPTKEELYVAFGALLLSRCGIYLNKRMCWSSAPDVPAILAESIRLHRFEAILKPLHLQGNSKLDSSDKLYKLRPLINKLNKNFRKYGGLEENFSIDESMIPYYGKHCAKQFIKGTEIKSVTPHSREVRSKI
ncbi:hypothetical protein ILUMI_09408 [Ignelater luminosus]|uniref:PiggyBac transposable element-derived protein domain-containing protein n=1 Tax=Ignelater luminosus TaxID=2038154 RepID=A0A8K0CZU1_IGNLU|nr:hypothetical protein ILUMI_09408 [Ignelater luminosus]